MGGSGQHSTKQIGEVFERIELLYALNVHKHLDDLSGPIVRRYARRLASRPPSVGARIKEPARTVEVTCFLRHCLFTSTDQAILMVQRRVADLWRTVAADVTETVNWADLYKTYWQSWLVWSPKARCQRRSCARVMLPWSVPVSKANHPAVPR